MSDIKILIENLYSLFREKMIDILTTDEYMELPKLNIDGLDVYDIILLIEEKIPTTNKKDIINGLNEILKYKNLQLSDSKINKIYPVFLELIISIKKFI